MAKTGATIDTILVGVDGSDTSVDALDWACQLASVTGGSVEALITWQWPVPLGPSGPLPDEYDPAGDARTLLEGIARTLADDHPTVPVRVRIVEGHPAEALIEGSRRVDLLVVGSRGHGAFAGMLLGSVSQHCASHAHSPVVIYRRDQVDRPGPDERP